MKRVDNNDKWFDSSKEIGFRFPFDAKRNNDALSERICLTYIARRQRIKIADTEMFPTIYHTTQRRGAL